MDERKEAEVREEGRKEGREEGSGRTRKEERKEKRTEERKDERKEATGREEGRKEGWEEGRGITAWLYCQFSQNFKAITIANGFGDCPAGERRILLFPTILIDYIHTT
jgi:hypothetical protein